MKAISIDKEVRIIDIKDELSELQAAVQGCIECVQLYDGEVMIVNEEGRLNGMTQNPIASLIAGQLIYGPVLIVGEAGENFTDVPEAYAELPWLTN